MMFPADAVRLWVLTSASALTDCGIVPPVRSVLTEVRVLRRYLPAKAYSCSGSAVAKRPGPVHDDELGASHTDGDGPTKADVQFYFSAGNAAMVTVAE